MRFVVNLKCKPERERELEREREREWPFSASVGRGHSSSGARQCVVPAIFDWEALYSLHLETIT